MGLMEGGNERERDGWKGVGCGGGRDGLGVWREERRKEGRREGRRDGCRYGVRDIFFERGKNRRREGRSDGGRVNGGMEEVRDGGR